VFFLPHYIIPKSQRNLHLFSSKNKLCLAF
jgi:hypothetical protein